MKLRQRQKHPSLGPTHVRRADFAEAKDAVVEEAAAIPHMLHGPLENGVGLRKIGGMRVLEGEKSDDAFGDAMNVDGIGAVVKIFYRAIFAEKVAAIEVVTATDGGIELGGFGVAGNHLQGTQVVAGMKIVDPILCGRIAIEPRAIGTLPGNGIAGNTKRGREEFTIVGKFVDPAQKRGSKEVGVMRLAAKIGLRIAEAGFGVAFGPIEVVDHVFGGAYGHFEAGRIANLV